MCMCARVCNIARMCNIKMLRDFIMRENKKVTYEDYASLSKLKFYLGRLKTQKPDKLRLDSSPR